MTDEARCPECGDPVSAVVANGSEEKYVQPCGHRVPPNHDIFESDDE